ncbi:kynurenine formamidase-like isoform X2 [Acanthaster planci]|uniref:Kynurenine formamidase-like isoform X2 n=1 Tax=Acanthaster planci TaxID=133434 RepID=A0A8B7ZLD8_ACAPL|nr:kynurenine formamidase-like isoform X2 [Acanthaster planci]
MTIGNKQVITQELHKFVIMAVEWKQLSRQDLDECVSPSKWSNRCGLFADVVEYFVATIAKETESMRKTFAHELDVRYGEGQFQRLDLYLPEHQTADSPVLLCIHGGYWQASSKDDCGVLAWQSIRHGAVSAVVNYTLAPTGTLPQMVNDIERALVFLAKKFPKARGFYICGHSAGGHLGAMMLSVDWSVKYGLPEDFIKGACLMSGVFDVRPLVKSYVNEPLHLTENEADQVSPINSTNLSKAVRLSPHCKIINVYGEHDPPIFKQMSKDYTRKLANGGIDATYEEIPGMDHFELVERLVDPEYSLTKMLLQLMSL